MTLDLIKALTDLHAASMFAIGVDPMATDPESRGILERHSAALAQAKLLLETINKGSAHDVAETNHRCPDSGRASSELGSSAPFENYGR